MIPTGSLLDTELEIGSDLEVSRTYKFDAETGLIAGMVDGLEAVRQAVYKILQTERFEYLFYSSDYGSEVGSLIGQDRQIYQSELKRTIEEALLQDDRVTAVEDMEISFLEEKALVGFTVVTPLGSFRASQEVT